MLNPDLIPSSLIPPSERPELPVSEHIERSRGRNLQALFYLAEWFIGWMWSRISRSASVADEATRLRAFLERMGGLWVKAGQLLSLRADIFPPEFCAELSKLQYRAAAFPWAFAKETMLDEFQKPIGHLFDYFEEKPFAAASISQVHRAHLQLENVWVAVKVQRPDIQAIFARDLAFFRFAFRIFDRLQILTHLRWNDLYWEIKQIVLEETDYRYEESNLRRMRKSLREHRIYVPRVFSRYCGRRVLVMEYIEGALMSDFIRVGETEPMRLQHWLIENNIEPKKVGVRLMKSFLRQLLEDNLFHGDLHPGNIVLLKNSRFAFIDLGTIGSFEQHFQKLYKLLMSAMGKRDYVKAADILILMCDGLPPVDIESVKAAVVRAYRAWDARAPLRGLDYHEKSIGSVGEETGRIMYKYRIVASWQLMKATRTLGTLDASLKYLVPDMNHAKVSRAYQREAAKRSWRRLFKRGVGLVSSVGGAINEISLLGGATLRRQAQALQGAASKASYFVASMFHAMQRLLILIGAFALGLFIERRNPNVLYLGHIYLFRRLSAWAPRFSPSEWVLLIVALLYSWSFCRKMRNRFAQKEIYPPRNI